MRRAAAGFLAALAMAGAAAPAQAQLKDILTAPITLIERAVEARSASDIATVRAVEGVRKLVDYVEIRP